MRRTTRKWVFVAQEAARLASLGLTQREIADRLEVNKSTVSRWVRDGKLVKSRAPQGPPPPSVAQGPREWAAAVRAQYALDPTDEQLVALAELALVLSMDPATPAHVRMSASARFQALVKQLSHARGASGQPSGSGHNPEPPPSRKRNPTVERATTGDPRRLLQVVK